MPTAVDEFVEKRVLPEHRGIVSAVRQFMRKEAPEASEAIRYGIPTWKGNRIFAFLSPTKKDITLAFAQGVTFEDKYGLLRGIGKSSRHIKFKKKGDVRSSVLRYYVRQALKLDAR